MMQWCNDTVLADKRTLIISKLQKRSPNFSEPGPFQNHNYATDLIIIGMSEFRWLNKHLSVLSILFDMSFYSTANYLWIHSLKYTVTRWCCASFQVLQLLLQQLTRPMGEMINVWSGQALHQLVVHSRMRSARSVLDISTFDVTWSEFKPISGPAAG